MKAGAVFLIVFTLLHAFVSVSLLIVSFGIGWETWTRRETVWDKVIQTANVVVWYPLAFSLYESPFGHVFGGVLQYVPLLLNSLLWAVVVWYVLQALKEVASRIGENRIGLKRD